MLSFTDCLVAASLDLPAQSFFLFILSSASPNAGQYWPFRQRHTVSETASELKHSASLLGVNWSEMTKVQSERDGSRRCFVSSRWWGKDKLHVCKAPPPPDSISEGQHLSDCGATCSRWQAASRTADLNPKLLPPFVSPFTFVLIERWLQQ